jgi:hypothetical protein
VSAREPADTPEPEVDEPPQRLRPRRAEPWNIGSVIPWGVIATLGDPLLLILPLLFATAGILATLGIGAPAAPETLVPVWSIPPFDAYQDAGVIDLAVHSTVVTYIVRALFLIVRTALFGTLLHLAMQRSRDAVPALRQAFAAVRRSFGVLLVLELVSWSLFGIPLVLGQGTLLSAGRQVSQLGAMVGQLVLINAFAAGLDGAGLYRSFRVGLRWTVRRPLGHLALAIVATAASNGVFWVARTGELGSARALPLAAYALAHSVVVVCFLVAFARRYRLLYAPEEAV